MKVLHVINGLEVGGAERMLVKLVNGLKARKIDSAVLSIKPPGSLKEPLVQIGAPVWSLDLRNAWEAPLALAKIRSLSEEIRRFDLIQGWMYHGNELASLLSRQCDLPHVWNIRCSWRSYDGASLLTRALMKLGGVLSKSPRAIVFNSVRAKEEHQGKGYRNGRMPVIPNGFDLPFVVTSEERQRLRQSLGIDRDQFVMTTVGRYHFDKDYSTWIQAARTLMASFPQVVALLIGQGLDESNEELLKLLGSDRSRFILVGSVKDPSRYYQVSDLFMLSSRTEAFPNVVGEAMAYGVPVVSTEVGDVGLLLGDTKNLAPVGDVKQLTKLAAEFVGMQGAARMEFGKTLRSRISDEFTLEAIAAQYEKLYREILE